MALDTRILAGMTALGYKDERRTWEKWDNAQKKAAANASADFFHPFIVFYLLGGYNDVDAQARGNIVSQFFLQH